jgi:transcriptional regulator with XRE-family HTH domain
MKTKELNVNVREVVGNKVRLLRTQAGLTQEMTATRCGIFRTYLSRIESGTANTSISVLTALATCLDVEVMELFRE